jgi:hypothetical protein
MTTARSASVCAALLTLAFAAPDARGEDPAPCLVEVGRAFRDCKAVCREDFQLAKDTCANRDHVCVEACRADRQVCREPIVATLNAALAQIEGDLQTAKESCRALYADGTPERDTCIDNAQVDAFQRRDAAREVAKPGLVQCRRDFKLCVRTNCPPLSVPDRAGVVACKADARDVRDDCFAACVEEKQLGKDACLDRDHLCVEACRGDRETCRQPFVDARAADLADCKSARDAAIDACPAPGDPARDGCVDQVQVIAFQCRDGAREAVQADLDACRQAFQTCAAACPPPAQ